MTRVLVFGTFDVLHKGHEYLFSEAKKLGTELFVVVARDETVHDVKGNKPLRSEMHRLIDVSKSPFVTKAILGNPGDKYQIIEDIKPNIICLGYDQEAFTQKLSDELLKRKIPAKIIRLQAFHPEKFKSSIVKKGLIKKT